MTTTMRGIFVNYSRLLSSVGRRLFSVMLAMGVLAGAMQGLALLCLLVAASALATGAHAAGLTTVGWVGVLAGLAVAGFVANYIFTMTSARAACDIMRNCHRVLGDQIARLPLGWFDADAPGRLSRTTTQGMLTLGTGLAHMLGRFVKDAAALLVVVIGAVVWHPVLGMVLLGAVPVYLVAMMLGARGSQALKRRTEPAKVDLAERLIEYARCQAALRSTGHSRKYRFLEEAIAEENATSRRGLWGEASLALMFGLLAQLVAVILIMLAGNLAVSGALQPIETLAFVGLALSLVQIIGGLGELLIGFQEQGPVLAVVDEVLDATLLPAPERGPGGVGVPGEVSFDGVSFAYQADRTVLHDASFTVAPRSMTALVGPSGSGKTTLTRLIARFYDADTGAVRVGGHDVRDVPVADLMAQLGMVFQDVYLFDDTLRANIRLGRLDASDDELDAAAELAGVTEIVQRLPQGWDARVGEGGCALSGGERQRVSIARALLKAAPIVLFDEATSALDAENEAHVVAAFQRLRETSTLIVIAHKLDTVESADQIVVLDASGRVSQIGRHTDLVASNGLYRDFCQARAEAKGWRLTV